MFEDGYEEIIIFGEETAEIIDPVHGNKFGTYTYTKNSDCTAVIIITFEECEYDKMTLALISEGRGSVEIKMYENCQIYHTETIDFTLQDLHGPNDASFLPSLFLLLLSD